MKSIVKYYPFYLFLVSPLIGFITATLETLNKKSNSRFNLLLFIICFSLGLINSKKLIESDLIQYLSYFELSQELTLLEYLIINFKDPIYYSFNYFFFHLISNDFKLFIFITTFLSYYFLLKATYIVSKAIGLENKYVIFSVIFCALFPQLFSFSGHIIRQFLATSISFYFLTLFLFKNEKKSYLFILLASTLIHSSTLLFIPLIFLKLKFKKVIKIFFFTTPFIIIVFSLVNSDNPLINGFKRIQNLNVSSELEPLSLGVIFLVLIVTSINFINSYKIKRSFNKIVFDRIYLFFVIIFFSFINHNEIPNRLLPILYIFWPIIISFFLFKIRSNIYSLFFILSSFLIFFVFKLFFGVWNYNDLSILLFSIFNF